MKVIYVKTTDTCNLNCAHCFTSGRYGGKTTWDVEQTQQWVSDFMGQYSQDTEFHLELHGGEPFLVPIEKLQAFVEPFKDRPNVTIGATSNLVYKLTQKHLDFITGPMGSRIGTSWDQNIRFENAKQEALWYRNLRQLQSLGVTIKLFISVTRSMTESCVHDFLQTLETIGADEVALERLTSNGNARTNTTIFPDNDVQDDWYLRLYQAYQKRKWSFEIVTLDIIKEKVQHNVVKVDTNCRTCEQNLVTINADGSLGGCPNAAPEHRHATINDSAKLFLNSEGRLEEIVKELDVNPICLQCDVFDMCGGDCHRLAWQGERCGGLKKLLRYVKRDNVIPTVQIS